MGLFKLLLNEIEDDELDDVYITLTLKEEKTHNEESLTLYDIVSENTSSQLYNNYNIYTTIKPDKINKSYNGYDLDQTFKTIDYEKIYDMNNNLISYDVKTNTENIFINNLPYDLIKKYSILQTIPLINNKIIGINEYQILLFTQTSSNYNLIYIYNSNIFGNTSYNRYINIISNYYSNTELISKYVNIIEDNDKIYNSLITITNDNKIELSNKEENKIISIDKNNNFIYTTNTLIENNYKLFRDGKILLNKLLNPQLGYYDNDIFMVLGEYNNNNCILFSNEIKNSLIENEEVIEQTDYSIIYLSSPIIFIPIRKNNILQLIYKIIENNEEKYYSYTIDNKFELLLTNTTYTIINNKIKFDDYVIQTQNNNIQILKNNYIILELSYNNYEEYKRYIYYTIYGTIELIIKDKATLKVKNTINEGDYKYDITTNTYVITTGTEEYIIKITEDKILINGITYVYYSKNIITYKLYSNEEYNILYDIDIYNKINISCNKIIKEPMFKENIQSKILSQTKDKVRYKVYNDPNNNKKYVFKCKGEI